MKPPRRRAGNRHAPQKSFLCISRFARARFFLPRLRRGFGGQGKGRENFFARLCSERTGRRGFASARARRNSPPTPPLKKVRAELYNSIKIKKNGCPLFFIFSLINLYSA